MKEFSFKTINFVCFDNLEKSNKTQIIVSLELNFGFKINLFKRKFLIIDDLCV